MSLLSRLPVARAPLRFVSAKHLSIRSGLRDVQKTVEPLPWRGHLRNEKARNVLRDIETAAVSQARSAWIYAQCFISSSKVGTLPRGDNKTEVFMPEPTGQWMPNIYQRERLPCGLFGCGGHSIIPASLKHCLAPWSPNYAGLHLVPARNYCFPIQVKPIPVPKNNPLGNTFTMDLGPEDQAKLQKIAYDQLKAHLKKHKVSYKKRGKKIEEVQKTDFMGYLLDETASKELQAHIIPKDFQVPRFIRLLLETITEKGHLKEQVFTKLPNPMAVKKFLDDVKANKLKNEKDYVLPDDADLKAVWNTTLSYFEKLPVPLMGTEKIDVYPNLTRLDFDPDQIRALHLFILSMTQPHRDTLHLLLTTLSHLKKHRNVTNLDIETLGQKFGPFLFRLPRTAGQEEKLLRDIDFVYLTKLMVYNPRMMFYVEPELMELLRSPPKSKFPWGIGKKKEPQSTQAISGNFDMRIRAPTFPQTSASVKTTATTKAEDVVFTYTTTICPEIPDSQWEYCLFEVGGNIGERCLDNKALIQQVYQVNPQAEFVIKEKYGRKKVEAAAAQP